MCATHLRHLFAPPICATYLRHPNLNQSKPLLHEHGYTPLINQPDLTSDQSGPIKPLFHEYGYTPFGQPTRSDPV